MEINLSDILSLLAQPPGSLVYYSVTCLTLILIIVTAIAMWSHSDKPQKLRHVLLGCVILLIIQIIALLLGYLSLPNLQNAPLALGFIDWLAAVLIIIWLTWTFLEESQSYLFTSLGIFLTLTMVFSALLSIAWTIDGLAGTSWLENGLPNLWAFVSLLIIAVGLLALLITQPDQYVFGVCILGVLAVGSILEMIVPSPTTYSIGAVHLAQTLSLPWMIVLIQRFRVPKKIAAESINKPEEPDQEQRVDITPALVDQLLEIQLQETHKERIQAVARAISLSVVADICYLVEVHQEKNKLQLIAGYDLIREEFLKTATLAREELSSIMDAWDQDQSLLIDQTQAETRDVATLTLLLRYHLIGNLLAYPLSLPGHPLAGGLIFLSPYTGKEWDEDILTLLDTIKDTLAVVLFTENPADRLQSDLERTLLSEQKLSEERDLLRQAISQLETARIEQENHIKQLKAKYQVEKIDTEKKLDDYEAEINALKSELFEKEQEHGRLAELEAEILQLTKARDQLRLALSQAEARIRNLETEKGQTGPIRLSTQNQILSLDSLVATTKLRMTSALQNKQIELEISNPDGRQMVKTDPKLLQTILLGLTNNAIEASEPGKTIRMDLKLSLETGMLVIQVTDFGQGLTQAEQNALFSAEFATIPGIGSLSSIREAIQAIRLLNGKIWLRSKKGIFTTFRVQLPVRIID